MNGNTFLIFEELARAKFTIAAHIRTIIIENKIRLKKLNGIRTFLEIASKNNLKSSTAFLFKNFLDKRQIEKISVIM